MKYLFAMMAMLFLSATAQAQVGQAPSDITQKEIEAELQRAQAAADALTPEEKAQARAMLEDMMENMSEEERRVLREHHPLLKD